MKKNATIMVVDDDPINLSLMEAILLPEGYDVRLCASGGACMEAIRQKVPDIILLDAIMPDIDGFQICKLLKASESTRMIPVVMVTSLSDSSDRVEALNSGADDFLSKPVSEMELLARVKSLVKVKAYHDRITQSEKRYRELVQDANVIILTKTIHGKITFVNDYGLSFFGYDAEELIEKTEIETILPEYESTGRNLKEFSAEFKSDDQILHRHTHENITKSRRRVWVDWTNRYVKDTETGESEWICVGVDVTATKRMEQERLRLYTRRKIRETLNEAINRKISQAELKGELRQTGIVLDAPLVASLLSIPAEYQPETASDMDRMERQHRIDSLIDFVHASKSGIACQAATGIVIVKSIPISRSSKLSIANAELAVKELLKKISGYWLINETVIGFSHSTDAVQDVADLYEQALAALQYGPVLSPGKTVYNWNDFECFQFILKDLHSVHVQQFIQNHLGPILNEKNANKRSEDLAILEALISGESFQVIADRVYVHKQTIMFRKKKFESLLGVDLDMLRVRMNLAMAIKMLSLLS